MFLAFDMRIIDDLTGYRHLTDITLDYCIVIGVRWVRCSFRFLRVWGRRSTYLLDSLFFDVSLIDGESIWFDGRLMETFEQGRSDQVLLIRK